VPAEVALTELMGIVIYVVFVLNRARSLRLSSLDASLDVLLDVELSLWLVRGSSVFDGRVDAARVVQIM